MHLINSRQQIPIEDVIVDVFLLLEEILEDLSQSRVVGRLHECQLPAVLEVLGEGVCI